MGFITKSTSGGSGSTTIDDASISATRTWSASKINSSLGGKATTIHTHTLADMSDVDTTNKTNGYALQYDSTSGNFISKPLPSGTGSGATNLDGLTDVDLTIAPSEGNILAYKSGIWKPSSPSGGTTYTIELSRWGITTGIPTKPYVNADYTRADANIQGINNALQYAADNGYKYVIMPKGTYPICYPRAIVVKYNNMTFDLNGSTFKVIYDSDRKSPFDTTDRSVTLDYYNFPRLTADSVSFRLDKVTNSHIINGTLIGCKEDRSFSITNEEAIEWTYGIMFVNGTNFSSVRNCKVSSYMGDQISYDNTSYKEMTEFPMGLTLNDLDPSTGQPITATDRLITMMINIPTDVSNPSYDSLLVAGFGFNRQTALSQREVGIYFYRQDNTFISAQHRKKIYTPISVPPNSNKFRIVFYGETNTSKEMNITLKWGLSPHHNVIEKNEIFNIHRGGITLGGNYNIVQNNVIHDGLGLLDLKPIFLDPSKTRYGINQEDSYGENCVIRNNLIYNCHHGVLVGCYSIEIHNNHIYNCTGIGINLYSLMTATVKENVMYQCVNTVGLMTAHWQNSHVYIENNTFISGSTGLAGSGYDLFVSNNTIINPQINLSMGTVSEISTFRNNNVKFSDSYTGSCIFTIDRIEGWTIEAKTTQREITLRVYEVISSVFINVKLKVETKNQTTLREEVTFNDCKFTNCIIENHIYSTKQRSVFINKSKLTDTTARIGNINTPAESPYITLTDCDMFAKTATYLFQTNFNLIGAYGMIDVENSRIDISNTGFLHLINHMVTTSGIIGFSLKRSTVTYSGGGAKLNLIYYGSKTPIKRFVSAENFFSEINLPSIDTDVFIGYDPLKQSSGEPITGYFFSGQTRGSATPTAGGYAGYICLTEGIANNATWIQSMLMTKGDQINTNGHVYEVITFGKTGKTIPTFPTASGATVDDNVGMVAWTSKAYIIGDIVLPTVSNGYFFECTTAGTSGATEPTTWSTSGTTTDGTVVWTPRKIITWKEVGLKATFKPYGAISV